MRASIYIHPEDSKIFCLIHGFAWEQHSRHVVTTNSAGLGGHDRRLILGYIKALSSSSDVLEAPLYIVLISALSFTNIS